MLRNSFLMSRTLLAPALLALFLIVVAFHCHAGDRRETSLRAAYSEFPALQDSGTAVNTWTSTSSLATGVWSPGAVAYGGYLYAAGGNAGAPNQTLPTNVAQYAPIQTDGSLGKWMASSPLNQVRAHLALAAYNGYIYAVGGQKPQSYELRSVEVAAINPSDRSLVSWSYTSPMVKHRTSLGVAVWNGHIYAVGGSGDGGYHASVEYAAIHSDGSLGTWHTTSSMSVGRAGLGVVAYNGYLYAIAGSCGWACSNASVEFAKINSDGSLGKWHSATALPKAPPVFSSFSAVAHDGYLYTFGNTSGVQRTRIKSDGSLGSWKPVEVTGSYLSNRAIADSKGYYYSVGGTPDRGITASANVEYVTFQFAPTIASFTPASQRYNGSITIAGENFSKTAADNLVVFSGDVAAPASTATADYLAVTVPVGATDGPIRVISDRRASKLSATSLNIIHLPVVSSFTPTTQAVGKSISITGVDFTSGNNTVFFTGGATATAASLISTTLNVKIPAGAQDGPIVVQNWYGTSAPSSVTFKVAKAPTITSFTPASVQVGGTLTILGTNFSADMPRNLIAFTGGVQRGPSMVSAGSLTVKVPPGARTGRIAVISNTLNSNPSSAVLTVTDPSAACGGYDVGPGCKYVDIQAAVDSVSTKNETFRIAPGTYPPVRIVNKSAFISLLGARDRDGNPLTVIDASGPLDINGVQLQEYQKRPLSIRQSRFIELNDIVLQGGAPAEFSPQGYFDGDGGGFDILGSLVHFNNCVIQGNYAVRGKAGFAAAGSIISMRNCRIQNNKGETSGNWATLNIGLVVNSSDDTLQLTNVTFNDTHSSKDIWDFGNWGTICLDNVTTTAAIEVLRAYAERSNIVSCPYSNVYNCGGNTGGCFGGTSVRACRGPIPCFH